MYVRVKSVSMMYLFVYLYVKVMCVVIYVILDSTFILIKINDGLLYTLKTLSVYLLHWLMWHYCTVLVLKPILLTTCVLLYRSAVAFFYIIPYISL